MKPVAQPCTHNISRNLGTIGIPLLLVLSLVLGEKKKENPAMVEQKFPLAFGLSTEDFKRVELIYRFHPGSEPGNGQEIRISMPKGIVLRREQGKDGKPEYREADISAGVFSVLLEVFETEGFLAGPREYGDHRNGPSRSIALNLPGKRHQVTVFGEDILDFEILVGAIQYAASLSLPEAIGNRFLPDL